MKGTLPRPGTVRTTAAARRASVARRPSGRAVALLAGVFLAVAAVVITAVVVTGHRDGEKVASLDGEPVTRDELLFQMRRLAPAVQNELRATYRLKDVTDWNARAGDRTALQRLTSRALDEIRRDRATLVLAKEQGLIGSVGHADFLAALARENASRAEAIAAGRTVYGVTEFTAEEFYTHRLTELATGLRKRLGADADGPLRVTDAEVRRAFDSDRGSWSANATTYRYTRLVVPVPDGASAGDTARVQRRVTAAGRLSAVTGVPGAELTTGTYDGGATTGLNAHDQDLMAVLGTLAPGRISEPVTGTGHVTYYELDGKDVDEEKAFADYSRRIRQSLVEKKFAQYLQRRVDASTTDVDTAAVDAINAEDVQR
ncbi:hypothetical protein [Streptomyces paludis]|uniref:PpiC domain-containing protein n=1 Tax=Streptomyces paludis TaxID=2282738 RepID=A0A345HYL7_9ACTN|nr:hypothetical protein [Streptomyces paludis]AXG81791.1 hypothetical protein DVK44_33260 [Streptomyces paludis]